ncbi:MAG: 4Fe-4S dicluster domain-containing protein [Bacteroidetes bacterium]|nr:4Fe-4S dicluster domain-containing protein [Bacteroidota bacterium]
MILSEIYFSGKILLLLGIVIFLWMLYFSIQSFSEKEIRAGSIFSWICILLPLPYFLIAFLEIPNQVIISNILIFVTLFIPILFFIPLGKNKNILIDLPKNKIDERDIMFSRRLLKKGSEQYVEYYNRKPKNLEPDENFRQRPGLLSKESVQYDPLMFASSEASFFTVDRLAKAINGKPEGEPQQLNEKEISLYIKNWAKKLGALEVGITILKDYHIYSHAGRGDDYGSEIKLKHKFAIAFTVEMDFEFTTTGPQAPIVMESGQQYLNAGTIAVQISAFIRNLGHEARAHIDANYQVICPLVAKDAGLGELGRMGLLMTPKHGPRVRIGVVTTNLPLVIDKKTDDHTTIDFCNRCMKCAYTCPSHAISSGKREKIDGVLRWQINQEKCFQFWCTSGTDCGRCMAVCPYSHPNNLMHQIIRFGIRNNILFRRVAVILDDLIYGRKPKPKPIPDWMKVSKN